MLLRKVLLSKNKTFGTFGRREKHNEMMSTAYTEVRQDSWRRSLTF